MDIRLVRLRQIMEKRELDGIMVYKPENIRWLSDFKGDSSVIIVAKNEQYFITDSRYTEEAEKEIPSDFTIIEIRPEIRKSQYAEIYSKNGIKRMGIEGNYLTVSEFESMKKDYPLDYVFVDSEFDGLRIVKSDAEIEKMKKAAKLTEDCYYNLLKYIKAGVTENDILAEMVYFFNKAGAGCSFDPIIASGPNSSMPHAKVTDRVLQPGDLLTMDFGCKLDGYCADFTRTIAISGIESDMRIVYNTVKNAQRTAMDALKPGLGGKEADKIARDLIYSAGYEGLFGHSLGHGVGLEIHEFPRLSMFSSDVLAPNMAVTVEPGIYIPGKGGVRIEDTVIITETGMESLYTADTELVII